MVVLFTSVPIRFVPASFGAAADPPVVVSTRLGFEKTLDLVATNNKHNETALKEKHMGIYEL